MNTIIQTTTNNLERSLLFYQKLNFKIISKEPLLLADNQSIIEINTDKFARKGIKIFRESWEEVIPELQKITKVIPIESGYLLGDSSGSWIYLVNKKPSSLKQNELKPSVLGTFSGVSLEVIDMAFVQSIYEILGFKVVMGSVEKGWISMTNSDDFCVSLMKPNSCPHSFFNPSLTYFNNKKNTSIIQKVRALEIEIEEEVTAFNADGVVDNIILRDEGGYGFFVFSD